MTWRDVFGCDDLILEVRKADAEAIKTNPKERIRKLESDYRSDKSNGFRAFYYIIHKFDLRDCSKNEDYIFDFDGIGEIEGDLIINYGSELRKTWKGETIDWLTFGDLHDGRENKNKEVYSCPYLYSVFRICCEIYDAYMDEKTPWEWDIESWSYQKAGDYVISWILSKYIECLISFKMLICVKRSWQGGAWVPVTEKDISESLQFFYYHNAEKQLPFFRAHSGLPQQPFEYCFLRARDAPASMVKERWGREDEGEAMPPIDPPPSRSSPGSIPSAERGQGRPLGSGSMNEDDAPLVEEMRQRIASGEFRSWRKAAEAVADRAVGSANHESKVRRLLRRVEGEALPGRL